MIEAENGTEALAVLRKSDDSIDLVLTDVVMPSMSGPEMVAVLRSQRPDLPVIFMSAYAGDRLTAQGVQVTEHEFIQKPFTSQKLIEKIRYSFEQARRSPWGVRSMGGVDRGGRRLRRPRRQNRHRVEATVVI